MDILGMGMSPQEVLIQPYLDGIPFPHQSHFKSTVLYLEFRQT